MKCGEFRARATHRIDIQQNTGTSDVYGGQTTAWSTIYTVWAVIEPLSGREVFAQEQMQSRVTSKMTIRYQSALKNTQEAGKYRIAYDSRIFPIYYVRNLADDMKSEGKTYQELFTIEAGPENE